MPAVLVDVGSRLFQSQEKEAGKSTFAPEATHEQRFVCNGPQKSDLLIRSVASPYKITSERSEIQRNFVLNLTWVRNKRHVKTSSLYVTR